MSHYNVPIPIDLPCEIHSCASGAVGTVKKRRTEMEIDWIIADFFSSYANKYEMIGPPFSFANATWRFQLHPKSHSGSGFLSLRLKRSGKLNRSVEYHFGMRKLDGLFEQSIKGIMNSSSPSARELSSPLFMSRADVQLLKCELAPLTTLVITCILKCVTNQCSQGQMSNPPKLKKFIKLDTLSKNFKSLLNEEKSFDAVLVLADREFKAHRAVLIARSSVFAAMFQHPTSEKRTGVVLIPDCDPESFEEFLEYLYTGILENPSLNSALNLYETSEKYNVQDLKAFCSEFLVENLTIECFCQVIIMADRYDDTNLLFGAQRFFNENLGEILVTPKWESLLRTNYRLANKFMIEMSKMKALV